MTSQFPLWRVGLAIALLFSGSLLAQPKAGQPQFAALSVDYKGSKVSFHGDANDITEKMLLEEARLIDIADRRFESK